MNASRWSQLMKTLEFDENREAFDFLRNSYNERHRKYHNESHIDAVLSSLDNTKHLANDLPAVELALWYHDVVYKIFSSTNELDSAKLGKAFVLKNSTDEQLAENVYALIMATQHNTQIEGNDETLIVDIDLAILGSSADGYAKFEESIRQEYKLIPWMVYKKKRIEILNWFLDREHIYFHEYFRTALEDNARYNLSTAIINLKNA